MTIYLTGDDDIDELFMGLNESNEVAESDGKLNKGYSKSTANSQQNAVCSNKHMHACNV